jgi:hypothetical protein
MREVAVQIDAARVLPHAARGAVGVEVVDDVDRRAAGRAPLQERPGDELAARLVAVDRPDDEHAPLGVRAPAPVDRDRTVLDGGRRRREIDHPHQCDGRSVRPIRGLRSAPCRRS